MNRISGVVDDRGKYIYITEEEMRKVADFIQKQGRVNMAALAKASNSLIDLNMVNVPGDGLTLEEDSENPENADSTATTATAPDST